MKEGLRILREKHQTKSYFDEEGHYINFTVAKKNPRALNDAGLDIDITDTSYISSTIEEEEDSDKSSESIASDLSAPEHLIEFKEATRSTLFKGGKFLSPEQAKKEKAAEEAKLKEKRDFPKRKTRDFKMLLVNQEKSKWLESHKFIKKKIPKAVQEVKRDQPLESSQLIRKIVTIGMIKDHQRKSRIEARKSFAFNFEFNDDSKSRNSVFLNNSLLESRKSSQVSRPSFLSTLKS